MLSKYHKILADVSSNKSFKTENTELKSLKDLRKQLSTKGKNFFNQYVTANDNHFANWVEGVFSDHELASAFRNAKSFGKTLKILDDRIKYAELWLRFNRDKELHNKSLASKAYGKQYHPKYHTYETVFEFNKNYLKQKPVQPFINKPPEIRKPMEPPKLDFKPPENHHNMLKQLESQVGVNLSEPKEKNLGFFARIFKKK
jgi:hypothetical protein